MSEIVLSVEHLALFILGAITLLSFMIAINAQGVTRLSVSFFIATIILVMTVFAMAVVIPNSVYKAVQQVDDQVTKEKAQSEKDALARQLEEQKQMITAKNERLKLEREKSLTQEKIRIISQLNKFSSIASQLKSVQLHDFSLEYSQLTAKAYAMNNKVKRAKADFSSLSPEIEHFKSVVPDIEEGLKKLEKAAQYYRLYYKAEDERQERVRESIIRSNSREAEKAFRMASKIVNSTN